MSREAQAWKRAGDRWLGRKYCPWWIRWWHRIWRVIDQIAVDRFWLSAAEVLQDYRDSLPVQPTTLCNEIEARWKSQPCRSSHWNCPCAAEKGRDDE